jgi:hypothetical protein
VIEKIIVSGTEVDVEIVPSALKHGKTQIDILSVLDNTIHDETLETDPNKTLFIGFDSSANLTEVILHVISDEHIVIYHEMDCRKVYRDMILK